MVSSPNFYLVSGTDLAQERARKVNIWAFTFLLGPFLGPFISSFLLSTGISWRFDFGILAIFYGVSEIIVVLLGEETLYDRENTTKPTAGASKLSILIGIAGAKAKGQTSLMSVTRHLAQLLIKPQLLFPSKLCQTSSRTVIDSPTSSLHHAPLYLGYRHRNYSHSIHSSSAILPK
jgi:MFS family permease